MTKINNVVYNLIDDNTLHVSLYDGYIERCKIEICNGGVINVLRLNVDNTLLDFDAVRKNTVELAKFYKHIEEINYVWAKHGEVKTFVTVIGEQYA